MCIFDVSTVTVGSIFAENKNRGAGWEDYQAADCELEAVLYPNLTAILAIRVPFCVFSYMVDGFLWLWMAANGILFCML